MLEEGLCPGGLITECVFFLHLGELDQATYPSPELTLATRIQDDGDVYDRLRLGWNLRFSRRNRKTFSFRNGNVVTCHLHFAKQNSKA